MSRVIGGTSPNWTGRAPRTASADFQLHTGGLLATVLRRSRRRRRNCAAVAVAITMGVMFAASMFIIATGGMQ